MRAATYGTFDLLHPGHLSLFRWCRQLAGDDGQVIVGVNRDDFVERYKGHRPRMCEDDRAHMVRALSDVDLAYVRQGGESCEAAIAADLPAGGVLVIGADWRDRDYHAQIGVTQEWLDGRGVLLVYVPLLGGYSSTALREAA